jgi:hypothetical protein
METYDFPMADFRLRQGEVLATLSEVDYQAAKGFQEDNTWHVDDEVITADSDVPLKDGPAILLHEGQEFPVSVNVFEFEGDDEPGEEGPACFIDIGSADGVAKLATTLGLV